MTFSGSGLGLRSSERKFVSSRSGIVVGYFFSRPAEDQAVILRWRILLEQGRKSGRVFSQPNLIIAATAIEHGLTLFTRNTKDFTGLPDLKLLNPWEPRT